MFACVYVHVYVHVCVCVVLDSLSSMSVHASVTTVEILKSSVSTQTLATLGRRRGLCAQGHTELPGRLPAIRIQNPSQLSHVLQQDHDVLLVIPRLNPVTYFLQ